MTGNMFSSVHSIKGYLSLDLGHFLVRDRPGDKYIVSYPRSGNTWLRTMLAYLMDPTTISYPKVRDKMLPGVSIRNAFQINRLDSPRFIKSHTWYRKNIKQAVYIVRDGRDVIISYYHYNITRRGKDICFLRFVKDYMAGRYGHYWHENVLSWLKDGRRKMGDNLLVVRFEDMKRDTEDVLSEVASFLEIPATSRQIVNAVEASSIENMRKLEKQRQGPIRNENASFYRGGKTKEWKEYFTQSCYEEFTMLSEEALRIAGYRV